MLSKEEIETCKEEARNYIEFMETAGDNAGWTRGLMWYIEQLESDKQKLIEKLEERIRYFEENDELLATTYDNYSDGTVTKRIIDEFRKLLLIVKGVENDTKRI